MRRILLKNYFSAIQLRAGLHGVNYMESHFLDSCVSAARLGLSLVVRAIALVFAVPGFVLLWVAEQIEPKVASRDDADLEYFDPLPKHYDPNYRHDLYGPKPRRAWLRLVRS